MRAAYLSFLFAATGFGQMASVPDGALEFGNGAAQAADTPALHAAAVALLNRADGYLGLHRPDEAPFTLNLAFSAVGPWAERGSGELEETWISDRQWRWTAQVGEYKQLRIFTNGAAYDETPGAAMPLPMQMLRNAVFGERSMGPDQSFRTVHADFEGAELSCLLISDRRSSGQLATPGRQWQEGEYCIDARSGLPRTWSWAPGSYIVYDYTRALQFHNRMLPGKIVFFENGRRVMEAAISRIADPNGSDALFAPSAAMLAAGPQPLFSNTFKMVQDVRSASVRPGEAVPVVVVHAVVDMTGHVTEAEPLQSGAMSAEAVEMVKSTHYAPILAGLGKVPPQRQAFITVRFVPAS